MIKKGINTVLLYVCLVVLLTGCVAARHAADTQEGLQGDRLTVGTVQREIRKSMSGGEVAQALGSPNIVSTDEQGREVWMYDKISTDRVYSEGAGGGTLILSWGHQRAAASSTSQRTMTVIIKFDQEKKVRDFAYHTARF
jgi:outer membrane protein assembly factor BamE (lipoprotein component of BamABCDE complex)